MSFVISILTFILILTSLFLVMVVLMQRAKTDGAMGATMGGGSMESTFGAEANNVLVTATKVGAIIFFVLSFGLYLAHLYQSKHHEAADSKLPTVIAPATLPAPQPATPAPVEPKKP